MSRDARVFWETGDFDDGEDGMWVGGGRVWGKRGEARLAQIGRGSKGNES